MQSKKSIKYKIKKWWHGLWNIRPIDKAKFPEHNLVWAEEQEEYRSLPSFLNKHSSERESVSCWNIGFFKRLQILFTGRLYLWQMTFGKPLQPLMPTLTFDEYYNEIPDEVHLLRQKRVKGYKAIKKAKDETEGWNPGDPAIINDESWATDGEQVIIDKIGGDEAIVHYTSSGNKEIQPIKLSSLKKP